jgi:putative transposase
MARPTRLDLPGIPQHVVQRGNDRRPCFFLELHYLQYLRYLARHARAFSCEIHAYVLMCNHVHLLVTPLAAGAVGRMMQALGRQYVGFVNHSLARTGTLWEGRYKSCLVDTDRYLLECYRYIELNPVRAGMVANPGAYRWSSFAVNALGRREELVTPHPSYVRLAPDEESRLGRYREFLSEGLQRDTLERIRLMTGRQRAFGSEEFRAALEREHGRPMGPLKSGLRPKLKNDSDPSF